MHLGMHLGGNAVTRQMTRYIGARFIAMASRARVTRSRIDRYDVHGLGRRQQRQCVRPAANTISSDCNAKDDGSTFRPGGPIGLRMFGLLAHDAFEHEPARVAGSNDRRNDVEPDQCRAEPSGGLRRENRPMRP
jgi:hypothetical protein